ncbi:Trace amine-associated receptor 9 [Holothuria leucospilota]|uniref:Trace amine-associated receptor 9 n=1 Tax=Holothuria leucospilota TaxID=206669 RepID=A0A9Q1CJX8_HOLLE|nr:Trace amine-associated receptor 9 [Holothuria leucospilota]
MAKVSNKSEEDYELVWKGTALVLRVISVNILGIVIIALNAVNIFILTRAIECFGRVTDLIFKTLALVDFSTGVNVLVSENIALLTSVPQTFPIYCNFMLPFVGFLILSSLFLLGYLIIDRLIAVSLPLRYPFTTKRLCIYLSLICILALAAILSVPFIHSNFSEDTLSCHLQSSYKLWFSFVTAAIFLVVIVAISCANIKLLIIACQQKYKLKACSSSFRDTISSKISQKSRIHLNQRRGTVRISGLRTLPNSSSTTSRRLRHGRYGNMKAVKTVICMTAALYIAYIPMVTVSLSSKKHMNIVWEFFGYFGLYCNSWMNPIIYLHMNSSYRRKFLKSISTKPLRDFFRLELIKNSPRPPRNQKML